MLTSLWFAAQTYLAGIRDERGASMVEYALLVVLIAIIAFVAVKFAGSRVSDVFSEIGQSLANS
jgi:pilus assembly protein Flp/PilA